MEVNSAAAPVGPGNSRGAAMVTTATPITFEAEAGRDFDWDTQMCLEGHHPDKPNAV